MFWVLVNMSVLNVSGISVSVTCEHNIEIASTGILGATGMNGRT